MSQVRFHPDYSDMGGTSAFVQWKGTNVCLDFDCACGAQGHFDGGFAYSLKCGKCGQVWDLPHTFGLIPTTWPDGVGQDVEMDDD